MERRFIHGGNIYDTPPAQGAWLDFSANINPMGLSSVVRRAIEGGISDIVHYPDPAARALKNAISDFYGVPAEKLVVGNGGAELFYVLFHAMRPKRVLLPVPSFSEYERAALSARAEVRYIALREEDGFRLRIERVLEEMRTGDCLILGNPNNPTGNLLGQDEMRRILAAAEREQTLVVTDESFMDFRSDALDYTARFLTDTYRNLVVIQSMTKFFALPGLRLGFGILSSDLAIKLDAAKDPWNTNLLAQRAGAAALADAAYQEASRRWLEDERAFLFDALRKRDGLTVYPPTVNFILLRLAARFGGSVAFCARMRTQGILVRDCSNYPGLDGTFVRVAVRTRTDNERLLAAIDRVRRDAI